MAAQTKITDIINDIPGGWYGNPPGTLTDSAAGNIVVDARYIEQALRWMRRRRLWITETGATSDGGVSIEYRTEAPTV